jgi:hypothetical protein
MPAISFRGAATPLTQTGLSFICQSLNVGAAEIWALIYTECDPPYAGFWADGRPQILYEQHIFHRLTNGKFDGSNPNISNSHPGNYGASGAHQYSRLDEAIACDESAALESASWGLGQTLGENYHAVGYATPQDLIQQMVYSEDAQLTAMMREIKATHIDAAFAAHDWKNFARVYNGPNYAENNYDEHLSSWYAKFSAGTLPDLHVRAAQMYLLYLALDPGVIDGQWGTRTRSALNQFQLKKGLPVTTALDDDTFRALVEAWNGGQ